MNLHNYLNTTNFVKSLILPLGYYFPINKIFSNKQNYAVLCYHRIADKNKILDKNNPLSGLEVHQDIFEEQIIFLKKKFKILSLNDLKKHIEQKKKDFAISITFDDGYLDNIDLGLPILEKHNVPATIFVITRFLEKKDFMWWYFLWENLNNQKFIFINSKKILLKNKADIINWYGILSKEVINLDHITQKNYLDKVFGNQLNFNYKDLIFDFDQLVNLSKNKLIEIGSHTLTHAKLTSLNDEEIFKELSISKKIIEEKIKKKVNFLAYPYGSTNEVNNKIVKIAKEAGYQMAFSTKRSFEQSNNLFDIPRINIDNNIEKKRLTSKINGFEDFLYNFKKIFF
jgi:peptidoglycan/xylan/chitin deacetylase (PgdA/CDA1 family)